MLWTNFNFNFNEQGDYEKKKIKSIQIEHK